MITRRQFIQHGSILAAAGGIALIRPLRAYGANIVAASPALSAVQAAVDAASNGDHVLIPNGSATWNGGITTTKQIQIRAQNYTPLAPTGVGSGTQTKNVSIRNAAPRDRPLFEFQTGNSFHVGVAGIAFLEDGTGENPNRGPHVRFTGTGTKVPLVHDCFFQVRQRTGTGATGTGSGPAVFHVQRRSGLELLLL